MAIKAENFDGYKEERKIIKKAFHAGNAKLDEAKHRIIIQGKLEEDVKLKIGIISAGLLITYNEILGETIIDFSDSEKSITELKELL